MVKNTYGTGCFMLMHTGDAPVPSRNKLLTTAACRDRPAREYALEGSVFIAGAVVQWLRDGLGIIQSSADVEALARKRPRQRRRLSRAGFRRARQPALGRLRARRDRRAHPRRDGRPSSRARLSRAIAYQTADVLEAMESDSGIRLQELRVDGGAARNDALMQFQADVLGVRVVRPRIHETTALGAAYLAGLAVGFWESADELDAQWQVERVFEPRMEQGRSGRVARRVAQRRRPRAKLGETGVRFDVCFRAEVLMAVRKGLGGKTVYGARVGILMLDTKWPRPPGDTGNALTWPFPVLYKVVPGASARVVMHEQGRGLGPAFLKAAEELVKEGADGITTTGGFLAIFQKQLAAHVNVPVASSSLMQVPLVQRAAAARQTRRRALGARRSHHARALGRRRRAARHAGHGHRRTAREFTRVMLGDEIEIDYDAGRAGDPRRGRGRSCAVTRTSARSSARTTTWRRTRRR